MALQEAEGFDKRYKGTVDAKTPPSSLTLLANQKHIEYRAHGEYVFVFDKNKVSIVAGKGQPCGHLDVPQSNGPHNYAYWCKFKV